jgi:hypothetical protein
MEAENSIGQTIRKPATEQVYEALKSRLRWRIRCARRRLRERAALEYLVPATRQ